jgi:anti-sigma factor RsiW
MTDDHLRDRLLGPDRPEVSCETCFELLDAYVDLEAQDAEAEARMPGMHAHLEGCPACREEHDSLLALVTSEPPGRAGS